MSIFAVRHGCKDPDRSSGHREFGWGGCRCRALVIAGLFCLAAFTARAETPLEIRVGVLKYGTVNWELDTVLHRGLDRQQGFRLTAKPFASPRATRVALLGSAVDVIVVDWIWVSRQRGDGADFTFIPYSTSVGALIARADSSIRKLADIAGARIGIAGGPLDKSWLLAQARLGGQGLSQAVKEAQLSFAAPPLLSELLLRGELDGVITYWHYAARLEAAGLRRVVGIRDVARQLGIAAEVPLLGYVFRQGWAEKNRRAVLGFAAAVRHARTVLASSSGDWQRLRPLMRAKDNATAALLRRGYLAGTPKRWGEAERNQAAALYRILAKTGGKAFTGGQSELAPGTFWAAVDF
ncbi:MAG TPA: ABC transporter substrate-binding protein [Rhodospirillales bacterium]|nr:ABC transporter substrate-binding protein [Rhodospirillales bacterium]